jgi:uncharacterized protein YoxC
MAAKKRSAPRKSTTRSTDDVLRAQNVLLEDLRSQMQFVLETVTGHYEELTRKIGDVETNLSARIAQLEQVVRKNSEDIRKNSEDIAALREEVFRLRHDFDHREDMKRTEALEARVRRVEEKLGLAS